ncbi:TolC family protein [Chitinophaga silvatica]|uniref:TolC family protein n=1 Tax=Chitinophaga silvatica TaxID=2282649 RepID=UPI001313DC3A|nr:TolC family protein [Chitinophaga silvatica]
MDLPLNGKLTGYTFKTPIFCLLLLFLVQNLSAQNNTLDFYVSKALSNSPLIKDYNNQIRTIGIDSEMIRASYKPQVNGTSNNYYAPVIKGWGYDNAITNGANISALVGVSKAIVSQKNLQTQFEALRLTAQGIKNTSQISEQDIRRTVTAQYILTYGDWQQLTFIQEVYDLLQKEDIILKKLAQGNIYKQTDYLTFLVTLQQQKLALKQADIQYHSDYATLAYLCGINDTSTIGLQEPILPVYQFPEAENSIFFKQYVIDSLKNINSRQVIDFSYRPKVNVFGDGGYNSSLAYTPYKNFGASIGISMTLPIYDGKQRKMKYSKIDIAEQTRKSYSSFFNHQYKQQLDLLSAQLTSTEDLIIEINNQIKYSEGLVRAHLQLLTTGEVRIADLVIALNNYMTAKNLLAQNRTNRWQIINQINYWSR